MRLISYRAWAAFINSARLWDHLFIASLKLKFAFVGFRGAHSMAKIFGWEYQIYYAFLDAVRKITHTAIGTYCASHISHFQLP